MSGRVAELAILITFSIVILLGILRATKKFPHIRKIAALECLPEAVGRAAEMGKSIHFTTGWGRGGLTDAESGPQLIAALAILERVVQLSGHYKVHTKVSLSNADMIPLVHDTLLQNYSAAGLYDLGSIENIRYFSEDHFAYATGVMGVLEREKPAVNIFVGPMSAETVLFAETGYKLGAIQVGGVTRPQILFYMIPLCDYALLGEELLAASAFLSKDPIHGGSLLGQEILKLIVMALIVIGSVLLTAGNSWLSNLLRL